MRKERHNMSLTHLSLFSGIGGLDLAAEWAGFQTVGQCEWADYPTKVLEKHWPDVPRWRDIRELTKEDFCERTGLQSVNVVSGGFPCQPHSLSGKRLASHDERDLWSELFRVFCETNAKWLVGENVPGLLSSENGRFFGRVLRDLAQVGCHVWWYCFPAHAAGAKFWGERIALVATSDSERFHILGKGKERRVKSGHESEGSGRNDQSQTFKGYAPKADHSIHLGQENRNFRKCDPWIHPGGCGPYCRQAGSDMRGTQTGYCMGLRFKSRKEN